MACFFHNISFANVGCRFANGLYPNTRLWSKPGGFAETMGHAPNEAVEHEISLHQLTLKRLGEPEKVANLIIFLASDLASFVTSSVYGVDGGSIRNIL